MDTVDPRVIEIALSRVGGIEFENFSQSFFAVTLGVDYIPMGGIHDGGADGALSDRIFEASGTEKFMQASVSQDPKSKIRKTIKRLREFGRNPTTLTYSTSQRLTNFDQLEEDLSEELSCRIVVRDGHFFQHQINGSPGTLQAYKSYLAGAASFLDRIGSANTIQSVQGLPTKTLCVFLGQELDRRRGKSELLESVTDSLILWALEDTDPDKSIFMTAASIEQIVIETLPAAKTFFKGVLQHRLDNLVTKDGSGSRKVNFHKKENGYCLPFETRKRIREENVDDEVLRLDVSDVFRRRAAEQISSAHDSQTKIDQCIEICHAVIHKTFHAQGLEIALFLEREEGSDSDLPSISDLIDEVIAEQGVFGEEASVLAQVCASVLRGTYYNSTKEERKYLRKLCRTYVLLFMLKNEPRIVEYFRGMSSNFHLYVGSDLIVRCLSEHMLPEKDQMTKNALMLLGVAGSELILTDKTLDEVWHHLQTTHWEFINNFQDIQNFMTLPLASQIGKILIRSFFYTKIERASQKREPFTWTSFIQQFITVAEITRETGRDELREYLVNSFGFKFEDEETLLKNIDEDELDALATEIQSKRNHFGRDGASEKILSRNAAITVLRVYQRRKSGGERNAGNPYGFKTWWLTQQTKIQSATGPLVAKHGSRYMMRPEFILHFLATVPSSKQVQDSYENIFPTILGIKLGNRVDETAFNKIISDAKDVYSNVDESRAKVLLAKASSQIQSDFIKRYEDSSFFSRD